MAKHGMLADRRNIQQRSRDTAACEICKYWRKQTESTFANIQPAYLQNTKEINTNKKLV